MQGSGWDGALDGMRGPDRLAETPGSDAPLEIA